MSPLTEQQVDAIAHRLAARMGGPPVSASAPSPATVAPAVGDGIHPDVDTCVAAATRAFRNMGECSLATRNAMIAAIRAIMRTEGDRLARLAHDETGLGRYADKVTLCHLVGMLWIAGYLDQLNASNDVTSIDNLEDEQNTLD